jgi:hypothetical protein
MKLANLHEARYQPRNITEEEVVRLIIEYLFQNLTEEQVDNQRAWQMPDKEAIYQALLITAKHEYKLYSGFDYKIVQRMCKEVAERG